MAEDSHGMGITLPPDSTKIEQFPGVVRNAMERVAELLAGGITEGQQAAVDALAGAAVANEITAQDIVTGSDGRALLLRPELVGIIAAITDAAGNRTWLEANDVDGGPTDWTVQHLTRKLPIPAETQNEGILFSVADAAERMTDLTVRESDGQFAQFVVDRLAARLGITAGPNTIKTTDKYVRGSELLPVLPDTKKIAGWGSSSMNQHADEFAALAAGWNASYYNGGQSGERSEHTAARLGSIPALVTVTGGSVPAAGTVNVTLSNVPASSAMRAFTGKLAGIPGTLAYSAGAASFTFTRTTAGTATAVPAGTPFIPDDGHAHRDAVTWLWMGKNDFSAATPGAEAGVIQRIDASFDFLSPLVKRALVIGQFADTGTPAVSEERRQILATNAANAARYGQNYLEIYNYITSAQVWADTGITPTQADLDEQALGNKPPSLSSDAGHFNAAGQAAIENLVQARVTALLGWY